jgi:hypothetical protein
MAAEMVTARARSNETLVSLSRLVVIVVERRLKMPVKSRLEQVHLARRFGASNLVKTRFSGGSLKNIRGESAAIKERRQGSSKRNSPYQRRSQHCRLVLHNLIT